MLVLPAHTVEKVLFNLTQAPPVLTIQIILCCFSIKMAL